MGYDGSLKFDTELNEKGFSGGVKRLGSLAKGGLAVIGGLAGGAATAFGVMTKSAVDSVASLEQNLGGIETLFKSSSQTVIENAKKAYMTAGMSANEYMQNVTSFSASLLQSLAGDTEKAAQVADMAMTDMSDNANKMGTSMEMVQNAYQGFAKQNYTMLDNLKLGYGGTKAEMERLLADAEKLTGVKYDISNLSDVYSAIHAIQENLGITGTTAKEASETISGSMQMAKAAFDNFLNGTGGPKELAKAMVTAGKNVMKAVGEIVPRLAEAFPEIWNVVSEGLSEAFSPKNMKGIVEAGTTAINSFLSGIATAFPNMITTAIALITSFVQNISDNLPCVFETGAQIVTALLEGAFMLAESLGELAWNIVTGIATGIDENTPQMFQKGTDIISNLLEGILVNAPILVAQAGILLTSFGEYVVTNLPLILNAGKEILLSLVNGIVQNGPQLLSQIGVILINFIATIGSHLPAILQKGIEIIGQLLAGIIQKVPELIASIPGIVADIGSTFLDKDWAGIGWDIIKGIGVGIKNAAGDLVSAAVNAAKDAVSAVKGWLGIKSPSRRMRDEVGRYMAEGVGVGFEKYMPEKEMNKTLNVMLNSMQKDVTGSTSVGNRAGIQASASGSETMQTRELMTAVDKLSKLATRPVEVTTKIDGTEAARTLADPMKKEIDKNESLDRKLRGKK